MSEQAPQTPRQTLDKNLDIAREVFMEAQKQSKARMNGARRVLPKYYDKDTGEGTARKYSVERMGNLHRRPGEDPQIRVQQGPAVNRVDVEHRTPTTHVKAAHDSMSDYGHTIIRRFDEEGQEVYAHQSSNPDTAAKIGDILTRQATRQAGASISQQKQLT